MKFHLLEKYLERCINTVTVEMTLLEKEGRTRHGESKTHLEDELVILKELAHRLEAWRIQQAQDTVKRMQTLEALERSERDQTKD